MRSVELALASQRGLASLLLSARLERLDLLSNQSIRSIEANKSQPPSFACLPSLNSPGGVSPLFLAAPPSQAEGASGRRPLATLSRILDLCKFLRQVSAGGGLHPGSPRTPSSDRTPISALPREDREAPALCSIAGHALPMSRHGRKWRAISNWKELHGAEGARTMLCGSDGSLKSAGSSCAAAHLGIIQGHQLCRGRESPHSETRRHTPDPLHLSPSVLCSARPDPRPPSAITCLAWQSFPPPCCHLPDRVEAEGHLGGHRLDAGRAVRAAAAQ